MGWVNGYKQKTLYTCMDNFLSIVLNLLLKKKQDVGLPVDNSGDKIKKDEMHL